MKQKGYGEKKIWIVAQENNAYEETRLKNMIKVEEVCEGVCLEVMGRGRHDTVRYWVIF